MVFGLGTKPKASKKGSGSSKKTTSSKKSAQSDEAAQLLKNMEAKKESGDCPFC